jgi:hypothetical protein
MENNVTEVRFKQLGFVLVSLGLLGFLADAIINFTPLGVYDNGSLPAASFFLVMIGFSFCYPSMLEENKGSLSTMRIIVFAVTIVFCVIYIKMAWNTASFSNLSIDKSWIYILGLAFGSKAVQKFGEHKADEGNNAPKQ